MSGGFFKKQKGPPATGGNRWSEGRECWGLIVPDAPELRPILLHLVGEGALGPTEGLGNGAVGDVVVVHPHGDDGVRIGVKLPKTGEKAVKQVAVCNNALDGRSLRRKHVHRVSSPSSPMGTSREARSPERRYSQIRQSPSQAQTLL